MLGPDHFQTVWSPGLESAYQSLRLEDYPTARSRFEPFLTGVTKPVALYYMAQVYLNLNQLERANHYINQLEGIRGFTSAHQHALALYKISIGWQLLKRRKWDNAYRLFEESLFLQPDQEIRDCISGIYLDRVKFMKRGRDLAWKTDLLTSSLRLNPTHEALLIELSSIYLEQNLFQESLPFLETLIQKYPDPERKFQLAQVYTYTGDMEKAFPLLKALHLKFPERQDFLDSFLKIRSYVGNINPEFEVNSQVKTPKTSQGFGLDELLSSSKFQEALMRLQDWKENEPNNYAWIPYFQKLYKLQKTPDQPLKFLKSLVPTFQSHPSFQLELARAMESTTPKEAEEYVADILSNHERKDQLQLVLVRIYLKSSRLQLARETLELLISEYPSHPEALFYLGVYHTQMKDFVKGVDYFLKADQAQPDHPKVILALATGFRQLGKEDQARLYFKRLKHEFPDSKYSRYASKIAPDIFLVESKVSALENDEDQSLPVSWNIYLKLRNFPNKFAAQDLPELSQDLTSFHAWDQLIEVYEIFLSDNPLRTDIRASLQELYDNYSELDFHHEIPEDSFLALLQKLKQEKNIKELDLFFKWLNPAVLPTPRGRLELGRCFLEIDRADLTVLFTKELFNVEGFELETYKLLGLSYFHLKDMHQALNAYYQALSLDPSDVSLLFKLAEILKSMGEFQKARKIYEEVILLEQGEKSLQDAHFYLKQIPAEPELSEVNP